MIHYYRDLFYFDVNLMKKQGVTDNILELIAQQFEVPRHHLRVVSILFLSVHV